MKASLTPAGLLLLICFSASAATRYVNVSNSNPAAPYTSWATAATTIQDAVDAAVAGDEIVVTNGVYAVGGRAVVGQGALTNRVVIDKAVTVRSVNGPQFTTIRGQFSPGTVFGNSAIRCVYITSGASLVGFTLTNGATLNSGNVIHELSGGGVWCNSTNAVVSQCIIAGNHAKVQGGGAYRGTLNNCLFTGNSATNAGATFSNVLNNCTIVGNFSLLGVGGAHSATLNNCIVYFNVGQPSPNYAQSTLNYSCTTPLPGSGTGNFIDDPLFMDRSGGNLRLQSNSPCINTGENGYAPAGPDLDGNARVFDGVVDIGAFEYQDFPAEVAPYIITQPTNITVTVGSNALFAVLAGGTAPLRYQWRSNTVPISFATNASFTVTNAQLSHSGTLYSVIVTNTLGSMTSSNALLTVQSTPVSGTRYVDVNSANPSAPFTSWSTAARTIQEAIDAALPGEEVIVTNGVYTTGGRSVGTSLLTNRVAVYKPIAVKSVNGPEVTVIQGYQLPGVTNGDGAIRCVYLTNGASLRGFTLTLGATRVFGDSIAQQSGGGVWSAAADVTVANCVFTNNAANVYGGGAYGPNGGTLNQCVFDGNRAPYGGGASSLTLNNCVLTRNAASQQGGGASGGLLRNCTIVGNVGGGVTFATLTNCIIYFNSGLSTGSNHWASTLAYCCTAPQPSGVGNITSDPLFQNLASSNLRLQSNSPCLDIGWNTAVAGAEDLDGQPRIVSSAVDLGAYEYQWSGSPVAPYILTEPGPQTVGVGSNVTFRVIARGTPPLSFQWRNGRTDLPDETNTVLMLPDVQLGQAGYYSVMVSNAHGKVVSAEVLLTVNGPMTRYVDAASSNPTAPYDTWATAAATIQQAVDVSLPGDEIVVTNGVYATGGRAVFGSMTNRVAVDKPLNVHSVNGPQFTIIQGLRDPGTTNGPGAIRCVYLAAGATLSGFTLTNGATLTNGDNRTLYAGGVWCEASNSVVINCVIAGNSAYLFGGGAYRGSLSNSTLIANSATYGGGADSSVLSGCTLTGNAASSSGGGANWATLYYCTVSTNTAGDSGGGVASSQLSNCILTGNVAGEGGGTYSGTLGNCLLTGNQAGRGGGAAGATLTNCTVVGNSATNSGGGVYGFDSFHIHFNCVLYNCIIYDNFAPLYPNSDGSTQYNCCMPAECCVAYGSGNITAEPRFVNSADGDFRLRSDSPCVDTGNNGFAPPGTDLDGNPRIRGSIVDIGAYEFQNSQPSLRIAQSGESITLAWPLWASDFELQQVGAFPGYAGGWSNLNTSPTVISNENTITMPLDGELRLFRLYKP